MKDFWNYLLEDARDSCKEKFWPMRLLLLVWMAYIFINHLGSEKYRSLFGGLNLGIHEFGHMIFTPFGEFMHFVGGSFLQCAVPLIGVIMFYRQRDYFAIFFSFGWFSINLFELAVYVGDARAMALPLVTPFGGHPRHDWNYLLGKTGLLSLDGTFAFLLRASAVLSMLLCLVGGAWIIWEMFQSQKGTENSHSLKP